MTTDHIKNLQINIDDSVLNVAASDNNNIIIPLFNFSMRCILNRDMNYAFLANLISGSSVL